MLPEKSEKKDLVDYFKKALIGDLLAFYVIAFFILFCTLNLKPFLTKNTLFAQSDKLIIMIAFFKAFFFLSKTRDHEKTDKESCAKGFLENVVLIMTNSIINKGRRRQGQPIICTVVLFVSRNFTWVLRLIGQ